MAVLKSSDSDDGALNRIGEGEEQGEEGTYVSSSSRARRCWLVLM